MPRASTSNSKKGQVAATTAQCKSAASKLDALQSAFNEALDDQQESSQQSSPNSADEELPTSATNAGKKRQFSNEEQPQDFSSEMHKMLECFGADITKTLAAKRKRLETHTQISLKTTNKRIEDMWKVQHTERQKLNDEFQRQVTGVFSQWETDLDKTKDQEEKLQNLFRQQQKLFQQTRVIQSQRLKTIRQLHDQYMKGMEELEKTQHDQQGSIQFDLKKEMALLQKKILIDTQHQEMASVRKSLQTMLF